MLSCIGLYVDVIHVEVFTAFMFYLLHCKEFSDITAYALRKPFTHSL